MEQNFFFFTFFSFFLLIPKKKKKKEKKNKVEEQNDVVSVTLTAAHNLDLMESYIDKNWKLEYWIDKTEN